MPISLKGLKEKLGTVTLFKEEEDAEGDEGALHVRYYLVPLTTMEDTIADDAITDKGTPADKLRHEAGRLSRLVASWDLIDDDTHEPLPIDGDVIAKRVPYELIVQIYAAIIKDRTDPNLKGSAEQSSAPSLPE
jgi:hypothetical protein